ncbi:hypothetical protein V1634_28895 [Plantactinospora veratri]|uniref:Uncharacterized protein n=1 Tax=Plantactinospora veratri TaxID=1436122 RepID=A0ABU7SLM0_9ACTN
MGGRRRRAARLGAARAVWRLTGDPGPALDAAGHETPGDDRPLRPRDENLK